LAKTTAAIDPSPSSSSLRQPENYSRLPPIGSLAANSPN